MSVAYRAIQWNGHKLRYDATLAAAVAVYIGAFVSVGAGTLGSDHAISLPILLMRATGTCAFVLLHIVLSIGPLARLNRRFLPLLYNRRHLGVTIFLLGLLHAIAAVGFYHGFGVIAPPVSLLTSNLQYRSISAFPFEMLGLGALLILFVMAATSHDFWLKNLSPRVWKSLHMAVYPAYGMLVMHVALGALQSERNLIYPVLLAAGALTTLSLHIAAGRRERRRDQSAVKGEEQWMDVCAVEEIRENRGKVVCLNGRERIALFRYSGKISALSNVCIHQGGPLGEGKIIDGCVTCPWHGYQYRPGDGTSPPPFTEKVATYRVRVEAGRVLIDPKPMPPGAPVTPAIIATSEIASAPLEAAHA
jgi:nitrite reductase/ring-hydroxylating ferredoxin subunit/DMSO/TMAO reductase YedYZ heme-binding membrane subunit